MGHAILRPARNAGSVLLESVVAAGLVAMVMAALATTASVTLGMLRAQRETISGSQLIQERLETMRAAGWNQITTAETLRDEVLNRASSQHPNLPKFKETITVSTYPPASPSPTPLVVSRTNHSPAAIVSQPSSGLSLRALAAIRIDVKVEWTSRQNSRPRSRETSTVISAGGLSR